MTQNHETNVFSWKHPSIETYKKVENVKLTDKAEMHEPDVLY